MPDKKVTRPDLLTNGSDPLVELYHDNGDGTWSKVVHTDSASGEAATVADGADVTQGAIADAAVAAGAAGTVSAKLRRLTTDTGASKTDLDAIAAVEGTTADTAVVSDANGTISAKLRGLVKMFADVWDSTLHAFGVKWLQTLDSSNDAVSAWEKGFTYVPISATGVVSSQPCVIAGYTVEASTAGTLKLNDNASAASGNTVGANAVALVANAQVTFPKPIIVNNGLFATIGGTSATVNVLIRSLAK